MKTLIAFAILGLIYFVSYIENKVGYNLFDWTKDKILAVIGWFKKHL